MKSSFWVLCGVVLLCFGSVRCKRHFSDNDDNFLDKTGEREKIRTGKEEDNEWQLYKARTVWNDLTNEIEELSRMERSENKGDAGKEGDGDDAGKEKDGDDAGKEKDGDDAGKEGDGDDAGKEKDGDDAGKEGDGDDAGKEKDGDDAGKEGDGDDAGKEKDGDDAGKEKDGDDAGKEGDGDDAGKEKDGDDAGKEGDGDDAGKEKDGDDAGKEGDGDDAGKEKDGDDAGKEGDGDDAGKEKDGDDAGKEGDGDDAGKEKDGDDAGKEGDGDDAGKEGDGDDAGKEKDGDDGGDKNLCDGINCLNGGTCKQETGKCDCSTGYTGDECEKLTEDECKIKMEKCHTTKGTCTTKDNGENIICICPTDQVYTKGDGCKDLCEGIQCFNGGTCNWESGVCACNTGYTGDNCKQLKEDECKGKMEKCHTTKGTCTTEDNGENINCICPTDQVYTDSDGCKTDYCKKKCGGENDKVKCEGDKFTEDQVVCGCKDKNYDFIEEDKECKKNLCSEICGVKPGVKCEGVKTSKTEIQCNCQDKTLLFDKDSKECKENLCPKVCGTNPGVTCDGVKTNASQIQCGCENKTLAFDKESKECKDKCDVLKCFNEGECEKGVCICQDGFSGTNCETLSKEKCKEELEICATTKGTCITDEDGRVECVCPTNTKFDDEEGCKHNFCKAVCGDKEGVVCGGDETKRDKVTCTCEKDEKAFDKKDKECKDDKCVTVCGIFHTEKEADVTCEGGPFGNVKCGCKDAKHAFDSENKECKIDFCKEKCGGETSEVKCDGNKFDENLECKCKIDYKDFNTTTKKCQINYCIKNCGDNEHVKCDGDPYKSKIVCGCDDESFLFKDKRCIEKCSEDDDCKHEAKCKGAEDAKLCECSKGVTEGDKCEILVACETGKYKNCKGDNGECVFNKDKPLKAECQCPEGKKVLEDLGYCTATCEEDKDCEGSNRKCVNKFCVCKPGYEGEDCSVVTGCKDLEENCKKIETKCVFDEKNPGMGKCECKDGYTYNRQKNACEDPYCFSNPPPCKDGECKYDDTVGAGYCECKENKIYNYKTEKCEDLIDKCLLRKTDCGENEKCENGECKCKYNVKEGEKCERKFCTPNPCFKGAKCKEEDGTCYCEEGKYYNYKNKECQASKCLGEDFKKNCPCPLLGIKKGEECVPVKEEERCSTDCGYGVCIKKNNKETCKCFTAIAETLSGKCVLKKSLYCPEGKVQDNLMKCKCEGLYTQADDGITCRLKTCDDEGVREGCKAKGGECEMKWKEGGFICKCPPGYEEDANGKCTALCSIEKYIKICANQGKFCYNSLPSGTCGCPPTLTGEKCSEKADNVFLIKNIFVLKERYELKSGSGINVALLSSDLMNSMELTFSPNLFQSGYLYDYRIDGSVVNCSVWINFKSAPPKIELNKIKLAAKTVSSACKECQDNAIIWPPKILLSDKGLQEAAPTKLDFCSNEVKDRLCGKGSKCENNKCTCDEGFKLIEYSIQKISDSEIQRCEDIDECALGIDVCSKNKNTMCVNTFGSYKCVCKDGFKKKDAPTDPETDKSDCFDMCSPSPCLKGECELKDKTFNCKCQVGVTGSFCDREDGNYKSAKKGTVVVGAVLGTLLAVIVLGVLFYIIKRRKRSGSEDFMPSPRLDHAEMAERRGMRGISNKAYE